MPKINLTLPDGNSKNYDKGITGLEVAKSIGPRLAQDALAIEVNGKLTDLFAKINSNAKIRIMTFKDKEGKAIFWHSTSHLMTQAVLRLFKGQNIGLGAGMPIDTGFYQDYDIKNLTEDDLKKIEKEMQKIVEEHFEVSQKNVAKKEAYAFYKKDPYKTYFIDKIPDEKVSMYTQGEFYNLCKGPHIPNTSHIKAFKLIKITGAYWKGDSKNKMLTRVYGVAFPEKKQLKDHLHILEEAKKRDHRVIGKQLDLFSLHEEGPGFIFFHPKGVIIINLLKDFMRKELDRIGYKEIMTPLILSKTLWEQSGHWDHYKENMYFTEVEGKEFAVKPMNCPGAVLVFKERLYSYKDLPIRLAEFGIDHRHELSGVLSGLFRVRAFTQDDAHIFCTQDQIQQEVSQLIDLVDFVYKTFNFTYHIELSTRPEKFAGRIQNWDKAEKALSDTLNSKKIKFKINPGDGAFYGSKIDFHIKDCLGRTWQCATIQIDFSMPEKFDLKYVTDHGNKLRPVMIHRTILGSMERFFGILIEHYAGKFPLWLAPIQARILTVSDRFNLYAKKVKEELERDNLRVELDTRVESVGYKVREAQLQKIPIIIIVGEKEEKGNTIAVRTLDNKVKFNVKVDNLINRILDNIEKKKEKFEI